jgi:hypothetical protein
MPANIRLIQEALMFLTCIFAEQTDGSAKLMSPSKRGVGSCQYKLSAGSNRLAQTGEKCVGLRYMFNDRKRHYRIEKAACRSFRAECVAWERSPGYLQNILADIDPHVIFRPDVTGDRSRAATDIQDLPLQMRQSGLNPPAPQE